MTDLSQHSFACMGTVVSLRVFGPRESSAAGSRQDEALNRAAGWFREVESVCSRFDPESELRRLSVRIGTPVPVTPLLARSLHFALTLAELTDGAFDPTVGCWMEARGFDRSYLTGEKFPSRIPVEEAVSFRDVAVDVEAGTATLHRPLLLDLGAVAKGLAVDLASRELAPLGNFTIDAGGDLYLGGLNEMEEPWEVGVQHPRDPDLLIERVRLTNMAICTSGDYERPGADGNPHILDPRSGESVKHTASVTVIAPSALVADGLGTAALVLGPAQGVTLIEDQGAEGLLITSDLRTFATPGFTALTATSPPSDPGRRTSAA